MNATNVPDVDARTPKTAGHTLARKLDNQWSTPLSTWHECAIAIHWGWKLNLNKVLSKQGGPPQEPFAERQGQQHPTRRKPDIARNSGPRRLRRHAHSNRRAPWPREFCLKNLHRHVEGIGQCTQKLRGISATVAAQ